MTLAAQKETPRVLEPGARIGRKLEVLRHLGEGGMGTLWVARNLTTEAEVAIKVLRPPREEDGAAAHAVERFRHEARLGAMLAHRNITKVFDLLEDDDGSLVLVMELLHGETLHAFCEAKRTLTGKEAVALLVPVLGALQHAHDHDVVHRDLKPSNIFLHVDPDGHTTPKLLDFGIAKMQDSSLKTRAGDVLGTPSYMSPEQVRASPQIDGRSDLFSIGSVLYEMITGENPFRTEAPSATLARVLEMEVDPDPRIEPRLWLEIQRALSKQPYERHASANELADALCVAVGEAPPARRAAPPRDKPVSPPRDKPVPRGDEPKSGPQPAQAAEPALAESTDVDLSLVAGALPKRVPRAMLAVYGVAVLLAAGGVVLAVAALRGPPAGPAPSSSSAASAAPAVAETAASVGASTGEASAALPPEPPEVHFGAARPGGPARPPRRPPGPHSAPKTPASAPPIARTPGF